MIPKPKSSGTTLCVAIALNRLQMCIIIIGCECSICSAMRPSGPAGLPHFNSLTHLSTISTEKLELVLIIELSLASFAYDKLNSFMGSKLSEELTYTEAKWLPKQFVIYWLSVRPLIWTLVSTFFLIYYSNFSRNHGFSYWWYWR